VDALYLALCGAFLLLTWLLAHGCALLGEKK